MSTRKTWKLFVAVMAGCMLLLGNQDAMAAKLTTGQLKKGCGKLGGVYFPPGAGGLTRASRAIALQSAMARSLPVTSTVRRTARWVAEG